MNVNIRTSLFVCSSLRSSVKDFGAYLFTQSSSVIIDVSGDIEVFWTSELACKAYSNILNKNNTRYKNGYNEIIHIDKWCELS